MSVHILYLHMYRTLCPLLYVYRFYCFHLISDQFAVYTVLKGMEIQLGSYDLDDFYLAIIPIIPVR